jgi:glycosyltransferase involved in cell wall biosynthesis
VEFTYLLKERFDIILIQGYNYPTAWFAFLGAFFSKTRIIFRGEADNLRKRSFLKKMVKRVFLTPLLRSADAVLYSFEYNKQYYKSHGIPEDKLFYFPCAVDNSNLRSVIKDYERERIELRKSIGINEKSFVIGFVGKIIARKRPFDIVYSYQYLLKQYLQKIRYEVLFVGSGELLEDLKKYTKEQKLHGLHFVGFKQRMLDKF